MWTYNYTNSDELYHYGVLGMKWGRRRYQNKDGSLTSKGKMRYNSSDSSTTKKVKNDYNTLTDDQFKNKYRTTKKTYAKRVDKYGDPYMNAPLAKLGKSLQKRQQKNKEINKNDLDHILASHTINSAKIAVASASIALGSAAIGSVVRKRLIDKGKNYAARNMYSKFYTVSKNAQDMAKIAAGAAAVYAAFTSPDSMKDYLNKNKQINEKYKKK